MILISSCWLENLQVINCSKPNLLPAAIKSCGLHLMHQLLCIYYAVRYAVELPVSSDSNKGLLLSASKTPQKLWIISLKCYDNILFGQLQERDGAASQITNFDIGLR
jgi:hypothetical protein